MATTDGGYKSALRFILLRELFGMKLGLENISRFLDELGHPERKFPSVHIAGTNGKGSTSAYLDSILRQAGYKTGLFTSPHLVDFRERIKINGALIDEESIVNFVARHKKTISKNKITFFELCAALAFDYFAQKKVDIAVIETGLGGRLDATNTITPLLSIITDISYDHTHILGETIRKIAYEKAGIIKPGVPILVGPLPKAAEKEIDRVRRMRKSPLYSLAKSNFIKSSRPFIFHFRDGNLSLKNLESSLPGEHQIINASLAIKAISILKRRGYKISGRQIRDGLSHTVWPGRFQIIKQTGKPTVILEVGHNPAGMKAVFACYKKLFPTINPYIIIGMVALKDLKKSLVSVPKSAKQVITAPLKTRRTANPKDLAQILRRRKIPCQIAPSITSAARQLFRSTCPDDIIIICGSHYGVGEFIANKGKFYDR
jgi:dihydrofolate synthase/folylpolyglutamate synthase